MTMLIFCDFKSTEDAGAFVDEVEAKHNIGGMAHSNKGYRSQCYSGIGAVIEVNPEIEGYDLDPNTKYAIIGLASSKYRAQLLREDGDEWDEAEAEQRRSRRRRRRMEAG